MIVSERVLWPVAVAYGVVVTAVAAGLLLGGSLLGVVPGLPPGVDRWYGASSMRVLAVLFRPLDVLPTPDVGP